MRAVSGERKSQGVQDLRLVRLALQGTSIELLCVTETVLAEVRRAEEIESFAVIWLDLQRPTPRTGGTTSFTGLG